MKNKFPEFFFFNSTSMFPFGGEKILHCKADLFLSEKKNIKIALI